MSMKDEPHYTLPAATLAQWIENQPDKWWCADGDPLLMGTLNFPCPADEIAPMIRKVGKNLLLRDKNPDSKAHGEVIGVDSLDGQCDFTPRHHYKSLYLCWEDSDWDWMLVEDEAMVA